MSDRQVLRLVADEALRAHEIGELPGHPWNFGDGILMLALLEAADTLAEERYAGGARRWLDGQLAEGVVLASRPTWEWGALPLAALALYERTQDNRYLTVALEVCDHIMTGIRRTGDGAVVTHGGAPQLWVDSMYYTAPALSRTAAVSGERRYLEEAVREIELHARHLRDETTGLFYHMWDEESDQHFPCLWGRGNAWAALATLEMVTALPADHPKRAPLAEMFRRQMDAVLPLQDASGLWHTVIDRPDAYLETSCTAMFAIAVVRGIREGLLPAEAARSATRAWEGVKGRVSSEGRVTGVSGGTLPGDFEVYQRVPVGSQTYGTGFFLLAGLELQRLPGEA